MPVPFSEKELQAVLYPDNPAELADRLARWRKDPASEPEVEYWYRNYDLKGKTLPRPRPQWEVDMSKYVPMINRAMALERQGRPDEALRAYLKILDAFEPIGTAYYERPAILLDRAGRTTEAIAICRMALDNPRLSCSHEDFEKRLKRLERKLAKRRTTPS